MDRIWAATDYAVIDVETTDLSPKYARPCEIAGVTINRGSPKNGETYETLVNPKKTISKDAIAIHGITSFMVKNAPSFEEQTHKFQAFLQGKIIVIHSGSGYDITVLRRRMRDYDFGRVLDTCILAKRLDPEAPSHKLGTLVERYELEKYLQRRIDGRGLQPHRALYDAYAAAYVFVYLIRKRMRKDVTLQEVLERAC